MSTEISSSGTAGFFARSWWVLLLRGLLAVVLGLLVFTRPVLTLAAVVLSFSVYVLIEGASALFTAISGWRHRHDRWLLLLEAVTGIGVGVVSLRTPKITAMVLIFFIAVWALATGVLRIVEAIRLRREISGEFWLGLSGLVSVMFALVVMLRPMGGALAMIRVIGAYALILGTSEIMLAFRVRGVREISPAALPERPRRAA